jgi:hypothetical protein
MSLFEDTNPKALKELIAEISSRAMALPDFHEISFGNRVPHRN